MQGDFETCHFRAMDWCPSRFQKNKLPRPQCPVVMLSTLNDRPLGQSITMQFSSLSAKKHRPWPTQCIAVAIRIVIAILVLIEAWSEAWAHMSPEFSRIFKCKCHHFTTCSHGKAIKSGWWCFNQSWKRSAFFEAHEATEPCTPSSHRTEVAVWWQLDHEERLKQRHESLPVWGGQPPSRDSEMGLC